MPEPLDLAFSIFYGLLGFFYVAYGKSKDSFFFILCGVGLMAYTFVTSSTQQVIWIGAALAIAPILLDKYL